MTLSPKVGAPAQSRYVGWPGGHCLRAPKAQEVISAHNGDSPVAPYLSFYLLSLCDPDV